MKAFINTYKEHRYDIESFVINTLKNNGKIHGDELETYKENFKQFPSMELLYITDDECKQITPNIFRHKSLDSAMNRDRRYLAKKLVEIDEQFSISEPYLSSATGNICITVMKKEAGHYIFIDFKLSELLGRLGLIELHQTFDTFIKKIYQLIGFSLIIFACIAIAYALISFLLDVIDGEFSIDMLFKPIVSITLGLAIFDLSKTILEREVYYKSYGKNSEDSMVLTKFSIAIIIALSIEALMVVFKIALHDYTQMLYALYLILGVGIIMISLGIFHFLTRNVIRKDDK
ncbi:MAG TPA: hypothetical protein ENK94_03445 [Campylobacterales bacterium]|nr:hypothetical protein [Campylobacterales bacterium]